MLSSFGKYKCECTNGYFGEYCQLYMNYSCDSMSCLNGGTCIEREEDEPICLCDYNFIGQFCEIDVGCATSPCQNDAYCFYNFYSREYICLCQSGYYGTFCEKY